MKILLNRPGLHTGRPYRVIQDEHGIGVQEMGDSGKWDETGPEFFDVNEAVQFIDKRDLCAELDRDEKRNAQ